MDALDIGEKEIDKEMNMNLTLELKRTTSPILLLGQHHNKIRIY